MKTKITAILISCLILQPFQLEAQQQIPKQETGFYRDIVDQSAFYEGTSFLRFDRLRRAISHKKKRALDVNVFDEVPDNRFFINRHGKEALSISTLKQGFHVADINLGQSLTITGGEVIGLHPKFKVQDSGGNEFSLEFDSFDYFELATASEIIASRFYYAIGYNVPQYDVVTIGADQLKVDPAARVVDDTGFEKPFTSEKLEEFLLFVPRDAEGNFRASVKKSLPGESKGYFNLTGRRKSDSEDQINHEDRRDVRALQVFSAWLGNTGIQENNTVSMLTDENGNKRLTHYLTRFNSTFGSSSHGTKAPTDGHEYLFDIGETLKSFFTLGFIQKPWQKKWSESGEKVTNSPAVGYFSNAYFDPAKYKVQLPYYALKDVSRADGFWAAKIIKSFSDEDIRALVETGKLSSPDDAAYLSKTLSERRDIVAKYWFEEANPLDRFSYDGSQLRFNDLSVEAGFEKASATQYVFEILDSSSKKAKKLEAIESREPSLNIKPEWFSSKEHQTILIKTVRENKALPGVLVTLNKSQILAIAHQD